MTRRQHIKIAKLWAANILRSCDGDSFSQDIDEIDIDNILIQINILADKIVKEKISTLDDCIKHALKN